MWLCLILNKNIIKFDTIIDHIEYRQKEQKF